MSRSKNLATRRAARLRYYTKYPHKRAEQKRAQRRSRLARDPEYRKRSNQYFRDLRWAKNPLKRWARRRNTWYRNTYSVTLKYVRILFRAQGRVCAICKKTISLMSRHTHLDHCHATGKVRGVLCHPCNVKLGWYEKKKDAISNYLQN